MPRHAISRSIPDPVLGAQILPDLTSMVLSSAGQQEDPTFSWQIKLFGRVEVNHYLIRIPQRNGEYLVRKDTARGPRATMRFIDRVYEFLDKRLRRYTIAGLVDQDEMQNADPWQPATDAAADAKDVVMLDSAMRGQTIALNSGNYGDSVTIMSGQGFNLEAGLTMREVINAQANAIMAATGIGRDQLTLALLGTLGQQAALQDWEMLHFSKYQSSGNYPNMERVRDFLGLREVWGANPIYRNDVADATPTEMFPAGLMILYYAGDQAVMPRGGIVWSRIFRLGGDGGALPPYYQADKTCWAYPWQLHETHEVFMPQAATQIIAPWQNS